MLSNNKQIKERVIWIAITVILLTLLTVLTFSNNVLADSNRISEEELFDEFHDVYSYIKNFYVDEEKIDPETLFNGAFNGMLDALEDPYSVYISEEKMRALEDTTKGEFGGIGIYISETERGIEVARPIPGTPAHQKGVSAGDLIIGIEGESTEGLSIDDVIEKLRGVPGTDVTITILRGSSLIFDVTITRAIIEIPTIRRDMIDENIGYLDIEQFTPKTLEGVKDAISFFNDNNYKALIIDLRSNPGGLLNSVIEISDLFLPKRDLIVSTKSRIRSENEEYYSKENPEVPLNIPIVILIDKYSASASEILTGALKDNERAFIVGETSFGKGSVQRIIEIKTGAIKLTVSRYFTPSDVCIDKIGIEPDLLIDTPEYSNEEIASFQKMLDEGLVTEFVQQNPNPTESEINTFIQSLKEQGILLREERILQEIFDEIHRFDNTPPVYYLECDLVLQAAVNYLMENN